MLVATDVPVVVSSLVGFGAVFVLLGYLVRHWWRILIAGIVVSAAFAVAALLSPAGYELDNRAVFAVLSMATVLALVFVGLGVALRSIMRPRD